MERKEEGRREWGTMPERSAPFPATKPSTSPRFCGSISRRICSDVDGDLTVHVDGQSFLLHKFPLVLRNGKFWKMANESRNPDLSRLELHGVPGGAEAFELAAKFCYGTNLEITPNNDAKLRCIAEYLETTEQYKECNLIARTETYLDEIVSQSVEKSLEVLCACDGLHPMAEDVGLLDRCIDAIANNVSKEQLVSGLAHLECDSRSEKTHCQYWWVEELSVLNIELYKQVITAMRRKGVRADSIIQSIVHYAQNTLKDSQKQQPWDFGVVVGDKQRVIVEALVGLLATEKITSVPLYFLFGILRMAVEMDAGLSCKQELERRIGFQLELASLDDLLIPSLQTSDSVFDVDTVHRILVNFLKRIDEEDSEESSQCSYESQGLKYISHSSVLKVGRLIDGYLAEIAPDPYLKLPKFMALIELLPEYARVIDDGIYRAIDIYLKAHPSMTESECKKLCKLIDCQKLSQEASNHAAQNDRLPLQMIVRVLYYEQFQLKSTISGNDCEASFSQRMVNSSSVVYAAISPRDNYASLRRENRELKLEISRMRVRLSELENEQAFMKQGMGDNSSAEHSRAFCTSISKGISKIAIFGPTHRKHWKSTRKSLENLWPLQAPCCRPMEARVL